jgi:hypothetical protein
MRWRKLLPSKMTCVPSHKESVPKALISGPGLVRARGLITEAASWPEVDLGSGDVISNVCAEISESSQTVLRPT